MSKMMGHYEIVKELGRGGMGVVLLARDPSLDRMVAIKVLSQQIAHDETLVARFKREAKSAASLSHPNIIGIYFIGEQDGEHYFAMEFVEGESLGQRIKRTGKLDPKEAAQVLHQTASGLAAAHDLGIIHRDIKPGNIMLTPKGLVKVADFGIAFVPDPNEKLTQTGQFMGTPGYIPPEVCLGQVTDLRSDIFSLGVVYYEMLTGTLPFQSESPLGLMNLVVNTEVPDVRDINPEVDDVSRSILQKMVEKDPSKRYQDCHALMADLESGPASGKQFILGMNSKAAEAAVGATEVLTSQESHAAMAQTMATGPNDANQILPSQEDKPTIASNSESATVPPPIPMEQVVTQPQQIEMPQEHRVKVPPAPPAAQKSSSKMPLVIAGALVLLLAVSAGVFMMWEPKDSDDTERVPVAVAEREEETHNPVVAANHDEEEARDSAVTANHESEEAEALAVASAESNSLPSVPKQPKVPVSRPAIEETQAGKVVSNAAQTEAMAEREDEVVSDTEETRDAAVAGQSSGRLGKERPTGLARRDAPIREHIENRPGKRHPPNHRFFPKGKPKVAVVAASELSFNIALEQAMEGYLETDGFEIFDESIHGDFSIHGRRDIPPTLRRLKEAGADVAVLMISRDIDQRELSYGVVYTAEITVHAINVHTKLPVRKRWVSQIEYNQIKAQEKAEEAVRRLSSELATAFERL